MIEYANEKVTKNLKQYDMLLKSLKYIPSNEEKTAIYYQMTKITEQIINATNDVYEEQYRRLNQKETLLMQEEKNRLNSIINLVNERRVYIENQIENNKEITSMDIASSSILGEDEIEEYKNKIRVIDKYNENSKTHDTLVNEIKELESKVNNAKNKIESNKYLNVQLENKMKKILSEVFEKLNLYELRERVKEIDLAYTELGYSLEKAKENAKLARKSSAEDIIIECDNMLSSITLEYERYKEKKLILKLMEIYKNEVKTYDELLSKRETMNNILSNITSSELYSLVGLELNKEYNTIKLEQQDDTTLQSLMEEKSSKTKILNDIEEENSSEEFKKILQELLINEKKHEQKLLEEERKRKEEQKRLQLIEEQKQKEEKIKQQRLLEEERKREIEKRTKQLLEEQQKSVLTIQNNKVDKEPPKNIFSINAKKEDNSNISKIPVIKNNNLQNQVIDNKKVDITSINKDIPTIKETRYKEEESFPDIPIDNKKVDNFFDDDELRDLNNYMESDNKKSWF